MYAGICNWTLNLLDDDDDDDCNQSRVLLLLDTQPSGGLTLCPTDVVATSGESVLMRAAGKPDSLLRWYRSLYGSSINSTIFTGDRMDYKQVDERYFVAGSREEEKTLNILNVTSADAGQFTVRDEFSRQAASVNLVVIGKLTQLAFCLYVFCINTVHRIDWVMFWVIILLILFLLGRLSFKKPKGGPMSFQIGLGWTWRDCSSCRPIHRLTESDI